MPAVKTCDELWAEVEAMRQLGRNGSYVLAIEQAEDGRNQKEAMDGLKQPGENQCQSNGN